MSDFGYINARLRSIRTKRISPKQFETILGFRDPQELVDWMSSSSYAEALEQSATGLDGLKAIDAAISAKIREILQRCVRMVKTDGDSELAVYLARTDFENVKAIARAIRSGKGYESAASALIPMPTLPEERLKALCELSSLSDLARQLMVWAHPAGSALSRFLRAQPNEAEIDFIEMDRALENAYFANALALLEEMGESEDSLPLLEALRDEVDLANLRTALKVAYAGGGPYPQTPLPNGRLKKRFLEEVAQCRSLEEALEFLPKTVFRKALDFGADKAAAEGDLGRLERCLEKARVVRCAKGGIIDPTGLGFTLSFLVGAQLEAQNLRLAARAVAGLIPVDMAEEAMIYV